MHETQWRQKLSTEEYRICREKGTEPPFSGKYCDHQGSGYYVCKGCGEVLFDSAAKFDSGSGWPSFDQPKNDEAICYKPDHTLGMTRTEIMCDNCGCHLGHVFEDGPVETTGKRYCVNSLSLNFEAK